jgi:hypothetical protein
MPEIAMISCFPISNEDAAYYQQLGSEPPVKVIPTGFDFTGVDYVEEKTVPDQTVLYWQFRMETKPGGIDMVPRQLLAQT